MMLKNFGSERDLITQALIQEEIYHLLYTSGNSYLMPCPLFQPEGNTCCRKGRVVRGERPRFYSKCIMTVNLKEMWQSTLL